MSNDPAAPAIRTVGVPKESEERRTPGCRSPPTACASCPAGGVHVFVETGAGVGASITDADFEAAGATIVATAADAWSQQMVVKVKEPKAEEFQYLRADLTLFTYLHLAAYPAVADALLAAQTTAVAYETVQLDDGSLPAARPDERGGRTARPADGRPVPRTPPGWPWRPHGRRRRGQPRPRWSSSERATSDGAPRSSPEGWRPT